MMDDQLMGKTFFRRYRMEIDLSRRELTTPELPGEYAWINWNDELLERHALVKYESFCNELDSSVFPCLGELSGCQRLMWDITHQKNFIPQSTWLIMVRGGENYFGRDCGTIQGIISQAHAQIGAIQNVGVIPNHRGQGLGRALVVQSLLGFKQAGIPRVYLEVTAQNYSAIQLYQSIGFKITRTLYKEARHLTAEV